MRGNPIDRWTVANVLRRLTCATSDACGSFRLRVWLVTEVEHDRPRATRALNQASSHVLPPQVGRHAPGNPVNLSWLELGNAPQSHTCSQTALAVSRSTKPMRRRGMSGSASDDAEGWPDWATPRNGDGSAAEG